MNPRLRVDDITILWNVHRGHRRHRRYRPQRHRKILDLVFVPVLLHLLGPALGPVLAGLLAAALNAVLAAVSAADLAVVLAAALLGAELQHRHHPIGQSSAFSREVAEGADHTRLLIHSTPVPPFGDLTNLRS